MILASVSPSALSDPPRSNANQMNRPATLQQLRDLQTALRQQRETGVTEQNNVVDPTESYLTNFAAYVWKEPKARYMAGALIVGESIVATMLWKRMAALRQTWRGQLATSQEVARNMATTTEGLATAERELVRSLAALEQADRAEILKASQTIDPRARQLLETALKPDAKPPAGVGPALPLEQSVANLEKAYKGWQNQAAVEARALQGAGRPVVTPPTLAEVVADADMRTRAITRLNYTNGQFYKFQNEGIEHLARQAKINLGTELGWKRKLWRKTRTGLLLVAIPVAVLGISYYIDRQIEAERRMQDLNSAALQDREKWLNTLVPYFHRPLLFAVVRAWKKVQDKEGSPLKRFRCPYELKETEIDNPHLQMIQAVAMQVLMEMEAESKDVLVENNMRTVVINPEFYDRIFRKILTGEKSPLLNLEARVLDPLIRDLAIEAYHAFDQLDVATTPAVNDPPTPPLNFNR